MLSVYQEVKTYVFLKQQRRNKMPLQNPPSNDGGTAITVNNPWIKRDQDGVPVFSVDYLGNVRRKGLIGKIY